MSPVNTVLRSFAGIALGLFTTLSVFGLTLALLWALLPQTPGWKLAGALAAAGLALCAGGFVLAWSSSRPGWVLPAAFGLLFGAFGFTYLLGPVVWVLLLAAVCALAAAAGGQLYRSLHA